MMINILTLIGIGTVAWILGRLIADLMEWWRIRQTGLRRKQ